MTSEDARPGPNVDPATARAGSPESASAEALRKRAETLARVKRSEIQANPEVLSPEMAALALHELRVHQIELEMQNEELRRTQEQLEISRARYFDLYDLAPVGYFTLSEHGLILEANLTVATLLGLPRGALVKQPLSHFILPEDQEIYYLSRKALLETGAPQAWELRVLKRNAAPFWVRVEATTAQDADGVSVIRAVVSDITESKRAEYERAKLELQNRQLQKAEGLGRMAGAIAHHFNNHLTAVMVNLEMALDDLTRSGQPKGHLPGALRAANDAATVSKLMLTYLGQTTARREPLDLSDVCRRSLPLLRATMPKHMVLETDLPYDGPAVSADASQLQQALTNLMTNAWEACGNVSSAIRLNVKIVSAADISAVHRFPIDWLPHDPAYACVEIVDAGCGIAHKDIEKLFDPFFSSKFAGRGLGLAVVLGIVRQHKGAVTVETDPALGSSFRVFLPVSNQKVIRQPDPPVHAPDLVSGGTVLLVEDEPMVREIGQAVLRSRGFQVLGASDGVEAVALFRRHADKVRLVICDLTMPGMNGWETLAALRRLAPAIPVILASGYDEAEVMAGDHPELPHAFLSKPYQVQSLRDAIGRALRHGKARPEKL